MWKWLVALVDTSKLAGWVRTGTTAILTMAALKLANTWFGGVLSTETIVFLSGVAATLVVGIWQQIAKKLDPDYDPNRST